VTRNMSISKFKKDDSWNLTELTLHKAGDRVT
jgi:hypothetical protein